MRMHRIMASSSLRLLNIFQFDAFLSRQDTYGMILPPFCHKKTPSFFDGNLHLLIRIWI